MKNIIAILLAILCNSGLVRAQDFVIEDLDVKMVVNIRLVNDTSIVVKSQLENFSNGLIYTNDSNSFFRRTVFSKDNRMYLYLNLGFFDKSYSSPPDLLPSIQIPAFTKIEFIDTVVFYSVKEIIIDASFDYIRESTILKNRIKCRNDVDILPNIYYIKLFDYKIYGKYNSARFVKKLCQ